VIYYDAVRAPLDVERGFHAEYRDLNTLLREADFVSVHVPLLPETRGLFNAKTFSQMKPTSFLINTSRGAVVDEAALVQALESKKIAGAALDVYEKEPLITAGLKRPNVFWLRTCLGFARDSHQKCLVWQRKTLSRFQGRPAG